MSNRHDNVAGTGRIRCDCECVFECLLELLEDALGENNKKHCCRNNDKVAGISGRRCECVFKCLKELLEDALEENNKHKC